jgi:hypothetical protein
VVVGANVHIDVNVKVKTRSIRQIPEVPMDDGPADASSCGPPARWVMKWP